MSSRERKSGGRGELYFVSRIVYVTTRVGPFFHILKNFILQKGQYFCRISFVFLSRNFEKRVGSILNLSANFHVQWWSYSKNSSKAVNLEIIFVPFWMHKVWNQTSNVFSLQIWVLLIGLMDQANKDSQLDTATEVRDSNFMGIVPVSQWIFEWVNHFWVWTTLVGRRDVTEHREIIGFSSQPQIVLLQETSRKWCPWPHFTILFFSF